MNCNCGNRPNPNPPKLVGKLGVGFAKGDAGLSAYEVALKQGFVGTESEWLASLQGEAGQSAYEVAVKYGYCGSEEDWLKSLRGPRGCMGLPGQSAYDIAVEYGFDGTPQEWIDSLKEAKDGESAYQIAVMQGFKGTVDDWLDSLRGASAYVIAQQNGYEGTMQEWLDSLHGQDGRDGVDGASAYQIAVMQGYAGTVDEWLASLHGVDGKDGIDGKDGVNGKSAYDLAVEHGFRGDVIDWLTALKGEEGPSAYDVAVEYGYEGTVDEWLASLNGEQGKDGQSAYQIAVFNGYEGTEAEWLMSLKGIDGADGKSAYEVAVSNGFEGSQDDWLLSLRGKSAYEVAVDNGFKGTEQEWLDSLKGNGGSTGEVTKESIGLGNVDNTADADKSVFSASQLTNPVNISFTGAFNASAEFDGSKDVEFIVEQVDATKLFGKVPLANLPVEELVGGQAVQSDWAETDENSPAFIKNKPENFDVDLSEIEEKLAQKAEISGDIVPGALMMMGVDGKMLCGPKVSEITGGGGTSTVVAGVTITVKATTDGASTIDVPEAVGDVFTLYHNGQLLLEDTHYIHVENTVHLIGFTTYENDLFTFIGYTKGSGADIGIATAQNLGLVKSSTGLNKVVVDKDGTMHVAQLDMSTLVTTGDTEIIFNSGSAN